MGQGKGLKNRGNKRGDVAERLAAVSEETGTEYRAIADYGFDPELASKNIENMIGVTQVPLGFAGPVTINGEHAKGSFLVPLATTEGALVASVSRGMSVATAAGGITARVLSDAMTRGPVFRVDGIEHGIRAVAWIEGNMAKLKDVAGATTNHGRLLGIRPFLNGRNLFLRMSYHTADAMGMNMATIASEAVCAAIAEGTGATLVSVSGNVCTDKKPAAINSILGRGKTVVAEAFIPKGLAEARLRASPSAIAETAMRKNLVGSAMAGSLGFNAHAANMVAALYIATGQDPAQVVEASSCFTTCESDGDGLYIAVRMPSVEVGTVGGGTRLPTQSEALDMIGCKGAGKAGKLAEIVAATVLAGELSTLAAQAAGHLGKAHGELGR
ncbi:MAG: hydroxymethylglutaryl-CoA reductase (NADPH) [Thermoplasmatales archaeon]|nr:hydroxymethylglutaryl-CoA reductase (NADPH) [Thermoplasmatales archaeon]